MNDKDIVIQNIKLWDQYVEQYKSRFMDLGMYKTTFDFLTENLPQHASVIELGCGPGNVIKYLQSKRSDLNFYGIDLAPAMVKAAAEANPGERFTVMDIRNAAEIDETFDCVIAAFSIPYITHADLPAVFTAISKLARKDALVYISFMEGNPARSSYEKTSFTGNNGMFISYYQQTEIESLLMKNGFEIIQTQKQDYNESDGSITIDAFCVAKKK